jgi:hypothetical protein
VFSNLHVAAVRCKAEIKRLVECDTGQPSMNTSVTKVIDNAIVDYALWHSKSVQFPQTFCWQARNKTRAGSATYEGHRGSAIGIKSERGRFCITQWWL